MRALSLQIFDRSFAVTYLLEAIAILVGLAGVAATFSAQTLARTKEFGMLRHLGVTRRQIIAMLLMEGALLGAVGVDRRHRARARDEPGADPCGQSAILQLDHGDALAVHAVRDRDGCAVAAAAATAVLAGRRALSLDAVRAVREDW